MPEVSIFDLRLGDDDSQRRWGGEVRADSHLAGGDVARLKAALVSVGVMAAKDQHVRSQFDVATRDAVIRLQWYLENIGGYIGPRGTYVNAGGRCTGLGYTGITNSEVRSTLRVWTDWGNSCAGNLVRLAFADYADIVAGSGFNYLAGPGEFIVDRDFADAIDGAQSLAHANALTVHINQAFRVDGAKVSGAVVTPATFSAHMIGRAIDLQLGPQTKPASLSSAIKAAKATDAMGKFRDGMKNDYSCRYGGDFPGANKAGKPNADPPHFDRQFQPAGGAEWKFRFFFDQRQYQLSTHNVDAIPTKASLV